MFLRQYSRLYPGEGLAELVAYLRTNLDEAETRQERAEQAADAVVAEQEHDGRNRPPDISD